MPLSRRGFLEASALSASGLVLSRLVPHADAEEAASKSIEELGPGKGRRMPEVRTVLNINGGWQFYMLAAPTDSDIVSSDQMLPPMDAVWEGANLPHSVRLEPRDVSGGRNYQGLCWYQKTFTAGREWKDRIVYLKFQGAMQVADIWLNGIHLTTHYGGYLPFTLDLSEKLHFERDNTLLVRLDNRDNPEVPPGKPQSELDFCYFGGLYRGVDLEVLDPLHITDPIFANRVAAGGLFVTYPKVAKDESIVQVQTEVANQSAARCDCTITQKLFAPDGTLAASADQGVALEPGATQAVTQQLRVRDAMLWHPEQPQLYWLHSTLSKDGKITDDQYSRIGIRSIVFERDRGLLINGEPFFSIGANRHQDHPYVGYALPSSAHHRDAYKLRAAGFTSFRSHYPQDPSFMDACDELGILAIVSNPGWQFVGDDVFKKRVYQDAREMVRRDRNHPSVIIWEAALNESNNASIAPELYRIVHEEFPGPSCYTAGDPFARPIEGFDGWDIQYIGHQKTRPNKPSWIREWGDQVDNWSDQQGRVRVARAWGETPMLVQASTHLLGLNRVCVPETKPAGADLWAGIDAYRGYHHQPFLGAPLDVFRLPKFDYYMFQSQRPPQATPGRIGSGAMVFIANFASFYSPSTVVVFSNCEQVRLTQNGKLLATQDPDSGYDIPHPPFSFKAGDFSESRSMLFANPTTQSGLAQPIGELLAEGLIGGKVVASHHIHSPGVPASIQLRVDSCGLEPVADGADWVRVYAHICDARETTHPYADDLVTFTVQGEGSLIEGAAIYANPVRAEGGIATALVRTTRVPGPITVRASASGLGEATLKFASVAQGRWIL
jgi:beta-galactosidase